MSRTIKEAAISGDLSAEHAEEEQAKRSAEYEASPAGTLDKVADLDELKQWIREHLL